MARDVVAVTLKDKVIKNLTSQGLTLAFHLALSNPASAPRELVRYRYRVTINQKQFLNMTVALDEPLTVPPGGETLVALSVKISYDLLFAAVGPVEDKALCDIVGDMFFQNERKNEQRAPFAFSGEFPVFQDPEIEVLPLKVNDLTLGGADVVFRPRFRNPNGYELIIDKISFALFFGDREVLSGQIPEDKNLPGRGRRPSPCPSSSISSRPGRRCGRISRKPRSPAASPARSRSCRSGAGSSFASIRPRRSVSIRRPEALI